MPRPIPSRLAISVVAFGMRMVTRGRDPEQRRQEAPHPVALAPEQAERAAQAEGERDREGDELEEGHRWSFSIRTCAAIRKLSLERWPLARL